MKQILKIISLLVALSAVWIGLLSTSVVPQSYALLVGFNYYSWIMLLGGLWMMLTFTIALFQLPIYLVVALGCYGLLMVGVGLMRFPTCPQEAVLLQKVLSDSFCTSMSSPKNWLLSMICFAFYFVELYIVKFPCTVNEELTSVKLHQLYNLIMCILHFLQFVSPPGHHLMFVCIKGAVGARLPEFGFLIQLSVTIAFSKILKAKR